MPTFNKEYKVKSNFERISIALASPEDIKERSSPLTFQKPFKKWVKFCGEARFVAIGLLYSYSRI